MDGFRTAASEDHAAGDGQVDLPWDVDFKGVGGDDFEGGKHDCSGKVGV